MKQCISFPLFVPSTRSSVLNGAFLGAKSFGITCNFVRLAQFHATRGRQRAILARYLAIRTPERRTRRFGVALPHGNARPLRKERKPRVCGNGGGIL